MKAGARSDQTVEAYCAVKDESLLTTWSLWYVCAIRQQEFSFTRNSAARQRKVQLRRAHGCSSSLQLEQSFWRAQLHTVPARSPPVPTIAISRSFPFSLTKHGKESAQSVLAAQNSMERDRYIPRW